MDSQDSLRRKIRIQGIVNVIIGSLLMVTLLSLILSMPIDIILVLSFTVLAIECTIAGIFANRASAYPSTYSASRYSRIQFISWIIWIILGALSAYILSVSVIFYSDNTGVKAVVVILIITAYVLIGILFYIYCKRAKSFMTESFSRYSNFEPMYVPQSSPVAAQVLYPGQPYPGDIANPQSYPVGSGQNYYAAQPVDNPQLIDNPQPANPPVNNPQPNELRSFTGQAYDLSSNNGK